MQRENGQQEQPVETQCDVLAIGNAIVDIIARTNDAFLQENGIIKAAMNLIDAERAELLYSRMGERLEASGGSAANTAAAIAGLGGKAAYFGKLAEDNLGQIFRRDMRRQGVAFTTPALPPEAGIPTARSMIFITPDGERSMNTYLGACTQFTPADIDAAQVAQAAITYFEGYLWDSEPAKQALLAAAAICHQNGRKMAMSLSDPFCVHRYREEFLQLIRTGAVDIMLANEAELLALYQTDKLADGLEALRAENLPLAAITRGENGSVIMTADGHFSVPAMPVEQVADTTGAGDLYAAGFLYGLTHNFSLKNCARLGSFAAGLVISRIGPRLPFSLREAAIKAGLIEAASH